MAKISKSYFEEEERAEVRINKYLSDSGMCSRREADRLVEEGKVLIDGVPAVMGSKVRYGQKVTIAGKEIEKDNHMVLIAFNKPEGIVCTTDRREPDNIIDFIQYGSRIFPIGRLDKDSEGLILLTNDGEIVNKILRAGNHHEKEYIVRVNKPVTMEFLLGMAGGVPILDTVTKPCTVEQLDKMSFRIVLTQGLNRQIRRMCEYFGYRVMSLQRIRIMNVNLGRLKVGTYRNLTEWEMEELNLMIKQSSNQPYADAEPDEEMMPAEGVVIPAKKPKKYLKKADRVSEKKPDRKNDRNTDYRRKYRVDEPKKAMKESGQKEAEVRSKEQWKKQDNSAAKTRIKGNGWTSKSSNAMRGGKRSGGYGRTKKQNP